MSTTNLFLRTAFADAMRETPLCCFDVGSRGGIEPDWLPVAFAVDAIGFEPDADECDRLNGLDDGPWRSTRYLPVALAEETGTRTLHVAEDPASSSLLQPMQATAARFDKTAYSTIVETADVGTCGLDNAITTYELPPPDCIKLDTEGLELAILRAGERAVAQALTIKTEISFMTFRVGQPPAREIDAFLSERGFELMDLFAPAHWRRHGHVIHPQLSPASLPYSRGQIAHGDYLYMRRPDSLLPDGLNEMEKAERRLRAAWLAMAYGYFDRAEEYLDDTEVDRLLTARWRIDRQQALRQASLVFGRAAWRKSLYGHLRGISPYLRAMGSHFRR